MNIAIIVAAGKGKRFAADKAKQFFEISGKPILIRALLQFENCPVIDEIVLVLSAEETENFRALIEKNELKKISRIVNGGETRALSVLNAINAIRGENWQIVAVHDGARPFVSIKEITNVIEKAEQSGGACLVASVADTIKEVKNGKITQTVNRENLRRALTPQAFRFDIIKRAFDEDNFQADATDECFLAEKLGIEIAVVEGSSTNIKITHQEDLILAAGILEKLKAQG